MRVSFARQFARLAGAFGITVSTFTGFAALADQWPQDIRFASSESVAVDQCEYLGEGDAGCYAPAPCSCSCNSGYCYDCPFADELSCRMAAMTGRMASCGVTYAPGVTQFYQGVAEGGQEQTFEYGGKVDQFLILDSGKLGLWQGMTMNMHAETRFGQDVNQEAVGFAPVNVAMLYPNAEEHDTAITGLTFTQAVNERLALTFGKFNALDMWYGMYPQTGRGVNGFMNASAILPLGVVRTVNLSFMGASAMLLNDEHKPYAGVTVFDTQNCTTTSGFDDLFDNGANIMGFYRYYTETNGLPGSHTAMGIWSTGEFVSFDPTGFVFVPGEGITVNRQSGAYSLVYIFEQTLWMDCCNPQRNVNVLSQWALADEETSPVDWSGNVAIQATGFNRRRPHDSMGVAYFHTSVSNDLKNTLSQFIPLHDVDGVEMYYNTAVMKGFNVTTDFQVIEPADIRNDTALVLGLRGTLGF